jgi:hypothetical protein
MDHEEENFIDEEGVVDFEALKKKMYEEIQNQK